MKKVFLAFAAAAAMMMAGDNTTTRQNKLPCVNCCDG